MRNWTLGLLKVSAALWALGCGGADGAETLIGLTCETSDMCDVTGVCIVDGPDGMCTQPCKVPGGAGQCPYGNYCTRGEFTADESGGKGPMTLCLPSCEAQSDCREGYSCNGVSSGPGKVCQP